MQPLREKEKQVFRYIKESIERDGYAPSVRDIQAHLAIKSTSTVHAYLAKLEEKGYIKKEGGKSRTLRIEGKADNSIRVPVVGRVTAGMPILAVEQREGYVDFTPNRHSYSADELFALKVRGESMIEAGIFDGDIVVVKKEPVAQNGEIVVALVGDEATVKTFYKENGHFRLQPENKTMEPIIVDEVYILGKVISLVRYY